ncbi:sensor histidine kinase [Streptomyces sp. 142MFCol3.1]|uniref:sensor histidine kinase n=1 Tax=Streptomyces sp. 142MFCol3.1 TaxID=1172179 RepID=UPI0004120B8D|nr:sensor histidine kinase [Streptomyces sp. 142MFCol3.1]
MTDSTAGSTADSETTFVPDETSGRPALARWRVPPPTVAALLALSLAGAAAVLVLSRPLGYATTSLGLIVTALGAAAGWVAGCPLRVRRAMTARALAYAVAEREQRARTRTAVTQERARIARELHDIVAHNVSLIVIQAAAARRVRERDSGKIRALHDTIEETGRSTVVELRRLLNVLRAEESSGPEETREPGIADIPCLLGAVREAGLRVEWTSAGTPRPVSAGIGLTAFRIVQEALTNSLKHAGFTRVAVALCWGDDALTVTVSDDGRSAGGETTALPVGGRHGLAGMRERVAAVGGTLHVGPRPEGGFVVRAMLPLGERVAIG